MTYIYKITNQINNKIYIGKTINIEKRWKRHIYLARTGFKRHLYDAMRKYGINNFIIEIIEVCKNQDSNTRERYWIEYYKSYDKNIGYNKSFGGEGGDTWALNMHKKETSAKLSEALKGHNVPEDAKKHISEAHKGMQLSQEVRKKISSTLKEKYITGELVSKPIPNRPNRRGVKHTIEAREKMSESKKGKTYEEIYGKKADEIRERQRKNFSGAQNPKYKDIHVSEIYNMIRNGCSNNEICEEFNISEQTMINRIVKMYHKKPTDIRQDAGLSLKCFIFENYRKKATI